MVCVLHGVPPVDGMAIHERRGPSQGAGWEVVQVIEVPSTPELSFSVFVVGMWLASIIIVSVMAIWLNRR